MNHAQYSTELSNARGKVIAVIYIFEGEDAPGFSHYEVWKGDLVGEWIQAICELNCLPIILDTRTFVQKAMDKTLPRIDFVVNLNNGNVDVSTLGLVPSICAFLSIPCIPCDTVSCVVGENKLLSNLIAFSKNINVPKDILEHGKDAIVRPISFGSSIGVNRTIRGAAQEMDPYIKKIYQEFIPGFDMTTPIMYNPLSRSLEVLPAVMYKPINHDANWFLGEQEKKNHEGYIKQIVHLQDDAKQKYLEVAKTFGITTYCRIDARVKCSSDDLDSIGHFEVPLNKIYFLEINPMPTVKKDINFHTSLQNISNGYELYECFQLYNNEIKSPTVTGFILSCSIIALLTSKYGILKD